MPHAATRSLHGAAKIPRSLINYKREAGMKVYGFSSQGGVKVILSVERKCRAGCLTLKRQ